MEGCFYHHDRIFFEDVKRALRKEKITTRKLLSYLPMAVCSCRRKIQPLPFSFEELGRIVQYFIHNADTDIKTQELKAIIRSICNANHTLLDNSYKKFIYIVYRALQKDYSLLLAESKYGPEETELVEESNGMEEKYSEKLTKERALEILSKKRKKFRVDKEVIIPIFPGNIKYLFEVTGKNFSTFSKKNGCLLFSNSLSTPCNSRFLRRNLPKQTKMSVNVCCKSEDTFKKVSGELSRIAKEVQTQQEMKWCRKRGVDFGVWKCLNTNSDFNCDDEEWETLDTVISSKPEPASSSHSNTPIKGHGQVFFHLKVPDTPKIEPTSIHQKKCKMLSHPINIRNGRIIGKNRFEDRIRRERERRKTFCESFQSQKDNRSSKSYTEEFFSTDFKSFVSDRYEKKLIRDKKTGGKKERIPAQVLQGGHCINCLKPFESLKAEPNVRSCVYHRGFINADMVWSCCKEKAINKLSVHEQHNVSGCSRARHNWRPHKKADRSKKRNQ